ncbi:MAG: DNA polymerase III subunit chi [Woeseia sp.]
MSRVDFYILAGQAPSQHHFACRLAEKAYKLDHTVHIHTADRQQAELLDDLLWTFRDGSFVPHELIGMTGSLMATPVTIGFDETGIGTRDLLINLTDEVPDFAGSFPRVAELVTSDDQSRRQSRKRFVHYRQLGAELQTHEIQ